MYTYDFGDNWEHDIVLEKFCRPRKACYIPVALQLSEEVKRLPMISEMKGLMEEMTGIGPFLKK
ncbi:IS1096 element passenger TnpR family protein [Siminovitchia sp. 179-K 8D1 HS]|uniref:IS1096 element passenger TnpR family protein n=1 Tax=Siminovitchia sp. 179-K 8D1 HS TaxID=3142385 RepID=UPI0039A126EE